MKSKKYIAIVKIKNNKNGTAKCVKYRFNNLLKFSEFLEKNGQNGNGIMFSQIEETTTDTIIIK